MKCKLHANSLRYSRSSKRHSSISFSHADLARARSSLPCLHLTRVVGLLILLDKQRIAHHHINTRQVITGAVAVVRCNRCYLNPSKVFFNAKLSTSLLMTPRLTLCVLIVTAHRLASPSHLLSVTFCLECALADSDHLSRLLLRRHHIDTRILVPRST